ncbi:hypothetical protein ON010_g8241 [Phytophthora cinnamomi]|nr:hypothetical protein ON010_g8241 [Phytophthora cinnamomi]
MKSMSQQNKAFTFPWRAGGMLRRAYLADRLSATAAAGPFLLIAFTTTGGAQAAKGVFIVSKGSGRPLSPAAVFSLAVGVNAIRDSDERLAPPRTSPAICAPCEHALFGSRAGDAYEPSRLGIRRTRGPTVAEQAIQASAQAVNEPSALAKSPRKKTGTPCSMSASEDDQFLSTELQSRSSVPSLVTTASSSEDSDDLSDLQSRRSLDAGLRRLSCISSTAKFAMKLNQIHHVKICATYDESEDGPTVYVMNVYLRYVQKGLPQPAPVGESEGQRKKRLRLERELERPVYQVEHRYSAFRELRRRIMKTVNARGDSRLPAARTQPRTGGDVHGLAPDLHALPQTAARELPQPAAQGG